METRWRDLRGQTTWAPDRFTSQVYQEIVAGKPPMSGARAALAYFALPDAKKHADQYAEREEQVVIAMIEAGEFTAFPDALRLLLDVREAGIPVAAASSSKNARFLLSGIRLDRFVQGHDLDYDIVAPGQTLLGLLDADLSGRTFRQGSPIRKSSLPRPASWVSPRTRASSSRTRCLGSRPPRPARWPRSASPKPTTCRS